MFSFIDDELFYRDYTVMDYLCCLELDEYIANHYFFTKFHLAFVDQFYCLYGLMGSWYIDH